MPRLPRLPVLALVAILAACQRGPRPLVAGTDACDFCRMTISDVRFGAELMSKTGRIHTFDAIECLASFYLDADARDDVRGVWVADFETGDLVPADSALFLQGGSLRSPMGRSLASFAPGSDPAAIAARYGGRVVRWRDVVAQVRQERLTPGSDRPHGHGDTSAIAPARAGGTAVGSGA
jgi:copper chaperone NosL